MNFNDISEWIVRVPVLLFAITIHEYSHGKAAYSLGDPTAKLAGRLTLNPLPHIDPLGAIALFLLKFGWAKPVPVNSSYFRNPRKDNILVSISGPISNLGAALLAGIFIRYFLLPWELYLKVLGYMILMNIGLGLFNLLPIPPLDGSHILENILPVRTARRYHELRRYGSLILVGIILLGSFAHVRFLSTLLVTPMFWVAHLFAGDNLFLVFQFLR